MSGNWTIEDEQCQRGYEEVQIFTVSLNGAQHFIYADPQVQQMRYSRCGKIAI
jgi:hypothetical protein